MIGKFGTWSAAILVLAAPQVVRAQDATTGKTVYARCAACHATVPGKNGLGPSLAGIVGAKAGAQQFTYSPAMKATKFKWDKASLDAFLLKPQAKVPGTKMIFVGLADAKQRADLIAYLATLKK